MIRINKSATAPNILTTSGAIETRNLQNEFNANANHYTSRAGIPAGTIRKFGFDNSIYGDETVKTQLKTDQHDKCCFCEAKFSDNSFGDVEHYRPKGAYKKSGAKRLTYPGYYWLAYDWNNLMYSCEKCNRAFKKNNFPLGNEATRKPNHAHVNPLANEDRLLINPNEEDPSVFITFKEEVPVPIGGSLKGSTSIRVYGLERLNNARLENLKAIQAVLSLVNIDETNHVEISQRAADLRIAPNDLIESVKYSKQLFNSAAKDTAKFTHCVQCKFPHLPRV